MIIRTLIAALLLCTASNSLGAEYEKILIDCSVNSYDRLLPEDRKYNAYRQTPPDISLNTDLCGSLVQMIQRRWMPQIAKAGTLIATVGGHRQTLGRAVRSSKLDIDLIRAYKSDSEERNEQRELTASYAEIWKPYAAQLPVVTHPETKGGEEIDLTCKGGPCVLVEIFWLFAAAGFWPRRALSQSFCRNYRRVP